MAAEKITANQALYNSALRNQVHLLRFSEGQAQQVQAVLADAERELLEKVAGAMAKGLDATRLEELVKSVKELRGQAYSQVGEAMQGDLEGLAEAQADWETTALKGSVPIGLNLASVPLEQLHAVVTAPINGIPLKGWLDGIAQAEGQKLQQAVSMAVIQGETIDDLVRRIRGTRANDYADGILSLSTRNAQALARTAVNHVSNAAREEVWNANQDIVEALRWTSTLDGRTSTICASRDGHMAPVGDSGLPPSVQPLSPPGARPPAHFNCRSVMIAVLDGVAIAGDRPFVADERTRAARERDFRAEAKERGVSVQQVRQEWADRHIGRVPAATTYQEWMKGQPASFQDEVLGRGKAELFRQGVPLERFVDKSGRVLSLDALKAELAGDALNVVQPAIGVKAKGLLMQGLEPDMVLSAIKSEFPDASTTAASIASYKSELKKAGLLPDGLTPGLKQKVMNLNTEGALNIFESTLPEGLQESIQGKWAQVVGDLQGHPGAYAHYKPGVGVQLSKAKLEGLSKAQAQQVMAHELGHLLHKEHGVVSDLLSPKELLQATKDLMGPAEQKLYSYYLSHPDELQAELIGLALTDGPVTSQGIAAGPFKAMLQDSIDDLKEVIAKKFPKLEAPYQPADVGLPTPGSGAVVGKPTSIGSYAKSLLMQGTPDDQVLKAVMAEFPSAKTTMNSIKSYKSELKKLGAVGKSGPVVTAEPSLSVKTVVPPTPAKPAPVGSPVDPLEAPVGGPIPLEGLSYAAPKPGGSNPGGVYVDAKGEKYLVKGNIQKANGSVSKEVSDMRAQNEVLAAQLLNAFEEGTAPEMKLVDLGDQYGGGLGVASKMVPGVKKFDLSNIEHKIAAQDDFALHAWLGNWDVVGMGYDNLVMKGGKAVNIDPGGALLFRAQGTLKKAGDFGPDAADWETMRDASKNAQAAAVYGSMSKKALELSAKRLLVMTDDKIDTLVEAHGPLGKKDELRAVLKARRDAILEKAGVSKPKASEAPSGAQDELKKSLEGTKAFLEADGMDFSPAAIAESINDTLAMDPEFAAAVGLKPGTKLTAAQVKEVIEGPQPPTVAPKPVDYKSMSAKELKQSVLGLDVSPAIPSWKPKGFKQAALEDAAAQLFKTGAKTDVVQEALKLWFQGSDVHVPTPASMASMKVKLKKLGLLEGAPKLAGTPSAQLPQPKLWGKAMGAKSTQVKEQMKALIQQGGSPQAVKDIALQAFSTPNPQGAADLYDLAFYEVKTGKVNSSPGFAATSNAWSNAGEQFATGTPTPNRPALTPREGMPPPPRFSDEDRQKGISKWAGGSQQTSGLAQLNAKQQAAGLDQLTKEEYAALRSYTGSAYRRINEALRDGRYASDVHLQAYVDAAQHGLAKLPMHAGTTHRGMTISGPDLAEVKRRYLPGAVVEEHAFISSSYGGKAAFGGNVQVHIEGKTGRNVTVLSIFGEGEREVLFMPGTRHLVRKVEQKGDKMHVYLEEVL